MKRAERLNARCKDTLWLLNCCVKNRGKVPDNQAVSSLRSSRRTHCMDVENDFNNMFHVIRLLNLKVVNSSESVT